MIPIRVLVPICGEGPITGLRDLHGRGTPTRRQWDAHGQGSGQMADPPASLSGLSRPQSPVDIYVEALSPGSLDRK